MKFELQEKLVAACPLLYKHFKDNPKVVIDCPDDLFEFIFELSSKIEDFNRRFPRRRVRTLKVAMESGELVFKVHRQIFTVNKLITATAAQVKVYRRALKQTLLARAKAIQSTALFGSSLIPDWKRLMPDDRATLQKILEYAENVPLFRKITPILQTGEKSIWQNIINWSCLKDRHTTVKEMKNEYIFNPNVNSI